jgi:hypothetical protein
MTFLKGKKAAIGLALASTLALGGCYDDGYGYGGISVGTGYYGDGYYGGYGGYDDYYAGGYGYPSYGWYNGFYYPGNGFYIYDRGGTRYRWNDNARRYWEGRRGQAGDPGRWGGGNGQWNGQRSGQWNDRRGGGWNDRRDRSDLAQPGNSGGFGRQRGADGTATPQAVQPQIDRSQTFTPRGNQPRGNWGGGYRGRNGRN